MVTPPPTPARERAFSWRLVAILTGIAVLVLVADVLTKNAAVSALSHRSEPLRLLNGLIYLDLTRNSGAAFSLGTGHTWVFPLVAVGVIGWIWWLARRLRSLLWALALGLIFGGAVGNLSDRVFRAPGLMVGHVVDFISVGGPHGQYWPIFNLADAALTCGVLLAVGCELTGRRRDGSRVRHTGTREPRQ